MISLPQREKWSLICAWVQNTLDFSRVRQVRLRRALRGPALVASGQSYMRLLEEAAILLAELEPL